SIRRRMARPVVVLPQPLSPTSPSTWPRAIAKETPSTALTWPTTRDKSPRLIGKCFSRPWTSSSGSALAPMDEPAVPRAAGSAIHGSVPGGIERAGGDLVGAPAARLVLAVEDEHGRLALAAAFLRHRAARMEAAAGGETRGIGHVAGDHAQGFPLFAEPRERVGQARRGRLEAALGG